MVKTSLRMFEGYALNQLRRMSWKGYFPLSIAGIMKIKAGEGRDENWRRKWINQNIKGDGKRFIDATGANTLNHIGGDSTEEWMPQIIYSSDTYYVNKDGKAKIVLSDERFAKLRKKDFLEEKVLLGKNGALLFPASLWDSLTGSNVLEISYERIREIEDKGYSPEQAKQSPEWNFLARNKNNLDSFVDFVYPRRYVPPESLRKYVSPEYFAENRFMALDFHTIGDIPELQNLFYMRGFGGKPLLLMYPLGLRSYSRDNSNIQAVASMTFKNFEDDILTTFVGIKNNKRKEYLS